MCMVELNSTAKHKKEDTNMMLEEFEALTGIYPTHELYEAIEAAYYAFDGDKAAFCKAYKNNTDFLAQKVQTAAQRKRCEMQDRQQKEQKATAEKIAELEKRLEAEQEWKPYVDTDNYQQERYDELKSAGRVMSDDEAKALLYDWYGFAKEKIKIHHSIPRYEVNRHRELRKVGEIERLPLYEATDWNYIRFDCGCMSYELINDDLRPFLH